ncbi:MAG: hypothetical protein ACT4OF_15945 [Caulobacteraceae bacterium]
MGCVGIVAGVALAIWGTSTSFDILRGQELWQSPREVEQVWFGMMVISLLLFLAGVWGLASKSRTVVAQFGMRVIHLYVSKDSDKVQAVVDALNKVIHANAASR